MSVELLDENATVERIVDAMLDAIEGLSGEIEANPAHLVAAVAAVAVRLCWATAKDKSEVRGILAYLVDDYATQSEHGPMVSQ